MQKSKVQLKIKNFYRTSFVGASKFYNALLIFEF